MTELHTEYMPLSAIRRAVRNPKHHDEPLIRSSIEQRGFIEQPIMDERTGRIVGGHGRLDALDALLAEGAEPPDYIKVDESGAWLAPVSRGWSSKDDADAERTILVLNRAVERGGWEDRSLADMLADLNTTDVGLLATGYDTSDLDALLVSLSSESPRPPSDHARLAQQEYAERYSIDDIVERAARWYEQHGFPYPSTPLHERLWLIERLARVEFDDLAGTQMAHGVADEWHPHRWAVRVEGKSGAPLDAFSDPKMLRTALRLAIEMNGNVTGTALRNMLGFVRGHQAAANFRPGFMLRCIREFCRPGGVVLDTSTGFGGRLVGFAASTAGLYVGIDPSTVTDAGNRQMADDLGVADRVRLIQQPAEDVSIDAIPEPCDMAMTSPPYFGKERYADEPTQSWVRYTSGEDWRDGFLEPMLALQYKALRSGAVSIINIADVKMKGKTVPLVEWTVECAERVGFERVAASLVYALGRVPGQGETQERYEPVLIFRRP